MSIFNHTIQTIEAEENFKSICQSIDKRLKTHPKSYRVLDEVCTHKDDIESFNQMMSKVMNKEEIK